MKVISLSAALCGATALLSVAALSQPAHAAELCISMNGSDGDVAGVQLDLRWDPACMSADPSSGNAGKCRSDPTTGKNVHTAVNGPTLKALMFSMSDTNPMPDGGLFCCNFTVSKPGGGCCALGMGNVILANPTGGKIQSGNVALSATLDGTFCAAAGTSSGDTGPARGPAPRAPAPPPAGVSIPGPGGGQAPLGGAPPPPAPAAPAGRAPAPAQRVPAAQAPEAVGEGAGEWVQTPAAALPSATARSAATGTARPLATPTAKAPTAKSQGTPTAAPKKTPADDQTPGATPKATAKVEGGKP